MTAELLTDDHGTAVVLSQPAPDADSRCTVLMHPLQLRHFAERFADMEPVGWMTSQPVKTLARRLRTLAFHIDLLYDYIQNHSDHRHADLSFELVKVTALTEMADVFCADLPDEDCQPEDAPTLAPARGAEPKQAKGASKTEQTALI